MSITTYVVILCVMTTCISLRLFSNMFLYMFPCILWNSFSRNVMPLLVDIALDLEC